MTMTRAKNLFYDLPRDIQTLIYEYEHDDEKQKKFNDNFNFYFKMYSTIKENYNYGNIRFFKEAKNIYKLRTRKDYDINEYNLEIMNTDELEEYEDNYIKENIHFIHNTPLDYERCLKDEYYINKNWKNGIKKSIIKKLDKYILNEESEKIIDMLDLETFKHNYFNFNSIDDLLNLNVDKISFLKKGEMRGTIKKETLYLLTSEY